eukprot:5805835-Alexandrium_andersonii.AAC.1
MPLLSFPPRVERPGPGRALDFRAITPPPAVYRLWACARLGQLGPWVASGAAFAGIRRRGAKGQ